MTDNYKSRLDGFRGSDEDLNRTNDDVGAIPGGADIPEPVEDA